MLPPVLMYQFSGYRIGLYIYLELLMLVILVCSLKDNFNWSTMKVIFFSLLATVVICWRSESIFYLILVIAFYTFSQNHSFSKYLRIGGIISLLLFFGWVTIWQSRSLGNSNYEIVATIRPCVELIRHAGKGDEIELEKINKILNVDIVKAHPDHNGEVVYWNDNAVSSKYSRKEYHDYIKGFIALCLRHPDIVWRERTQVFKNTIGLKTKGFNNVDPSVETYIPGKWTYSAQTEIITKNKYPSFIRLRSKVIHMMGMEHKLKIVQPFYSIVWNVITPVFVIVMGIVVLVKYKKWNFASILAFVGIKIPLVFLAAPSDWFMYYLSFYFIGYVLLDYYFLYLLSRRKEEKVNV